MIPARVIALAAALMCSAANAQTTVDVPIDQARSIMLRAAQTGEPELAAEVANAILAQRPDDREALLVLAATAPQLGDAPAGRVAGARAWRLSENAIQRYEAARLTALAAANAEQFTRATLWLRLALIDAPNEAERDRTIADGRIVARRNPWSTQLSFSLVPSNNVNGGAEEEESTAPGNPTGTLSADAVALSGWRGSLGLTTQYRLQESPTSRTTVALQTSLARVRLTEDTEVPDEAFDINAGTISLRHDRVLDNGTISGTLSRGVVSYRDLDLDTETTEEESYDIWRLSLDRRVPLSDVTVLGLSYTRELLSYEVVGIGEINRNILGTSLSYRLQSGDQITGSFGFTDSVGDSVNYTSREKTIRLRYAWSDPIGPISLSLGAGVKRADYPDYRIFLPVTGGRQDETIFAEANIGFPDASFAGFTPRLRLDVSKVDSNVSRFDRDNSSIGFTITSQF